jgi:hypothetical protein
MFSVPWLICPEIILLEKVKIKSETEKQMDLKAIDFAALMKAPTK